jgi:hypothetical protein
MLLQTNSYIVPHDKRSEHAKLLRRFRQTLLRIGCDSFEVYEQVGPNWNSTQSSGRFVQIMQFRDRRHQQAVQQAEKADAMAQRLISDFCQLINFGYQQQQGLFATSYYTSLFSPEVLRGSSPSSVRPPDQASAEAASPALVIPDEPSTTAASLTGADETEPAPMVDFSQLQEISDEENTADLPIGDAVNVVTAPQAPTDVENAEFAEGKIQPSDEHPLRQAMQEVKEELAAAPHPEAVHHHSDEPVIEALEERSTHAEHEDTLPTGSHEDGFDFILDEIDRK